MESQRPAAKNQRPRMPQRFSLRIPPINAQSSAQWPVRYRFDRGFYRHLRPLFLHGGNFFAFYSGEKTSFNFAVLSATMLSNVGGGAEKGPKKSG